MQFDFDVVGTCLSNKFNGMAVATIPTEKQEEFKTAIQRVINTKINYIMFNIIFNNTHPAVFPNIKCLWDCFVSPVKPCFV